MLELQPDECRVLGVLIEKAQTTPAQYPLSINGIVTGANQKNNREPVSNFDEERALRAIDRLRRNRLVIEVDMSGSRVLKYRHEARDVLNVRTPALVVLAEMLLRGPQTIGELRSRASRMHPFESMEAVKATLDSMMSGESPLVQQVAPAPGSRAERYAQLLCPDLHPIRTASHANEGESGEDVGSDEETPFRVTRLGGRLEQLESKVESQEAEIHALRDYLSKLAASLGEPGPEASA
jgi:uncharacterized protein YceH (UPF0502 family)